MNDIMQSEIQYCNHCGSANKKSSVQCSECEKKIHTSYRPFYDFLKKHTKESLADTVKDTVFSYIKNFLLSHIYGTVLTVTIVATTVSAVSAATPYIEKVSEPKTAVTQTASGQQPEEELPIAQPLTEDDLYDFRHLSSNYDAFVDLRRSSDGYWDQSVSYYGSASEMYAENNIEGFNYGGVHEMISNPIAMHMLDVDPNFVDYEYSHIYSDRYSDDASAVTGETCTSAIAKTLLNDGYRVAECNYVLSEAEGEYSYDTHTGSNVVKKLVYKIVYVEHEGEWYIVEDRLIERKNV